MSHYLSNNINWKCSKGLLLRVFSFFILIFYSCNNKNVENQGTALIDSLITAITDVERTANNINFGQSEINRRSAIEQMGIVNGFITDSTVKNNNSLLKNYQQFASPYNDKSNYTDSQRKLYILKELNYSKNQLKNLKADFLNGNLEEVKFNTYLKMERQKTFQIINFVKKEQQIIERNLNIFDSINSQMTLYIDSLKNLGTVKDK